ncbi:hypothetical protein M9458_002166, partial [Cirrhinus mrigala]
CETPSVLPSVVAPLGVVPASGHRLCINWSFNYYYTHSIWHVMVATSVVFLLPPREKHVPPWGWTNKICSYRRCKNEKVELYTVT